jgi:hypothetical protein
MASAQANKSNNDDSSCSTDHNTGKEHNVETKDSLKKIKRVQEGFTNCIDVLLEDIPGARTLLSGKETSNDLAPTHIVQPIQFLLNHHWKIHIKQSCMYSSIRYGMNHKDKKQKNKVVDIDGVYSIKEGNVFCLVETHDILYVFSVKNEIK